MAGFSSALGTASGAIVGSFSSTNTTREDEAISEHPFSAQGPMSVYTLQRSQSAAEYELWNREIGARRASANERLSRSDTSLRSTLCRQRRFRIPAAAPLTFSFAPFHFVEAGQLAADRFKAFHDDPGVRRVQSCPAAHDAPIQTPASFFVAAEQPWPMQRPDYFCAGLELVTAAVLPQTATSRRASAAAAAAGGHECGVWVAPSQVAPRSRAQSRNSTTRTAAPLHAPCFLSLAFDRFPLTYVTELSFNPGQEVAPGGGRAYAGPKTAAAALADDPVHDDRAHGPAE